jgi:hypothetical protein
MIRQRLLMFHARLDTTPVGILLGLVDVEALGDNRNYRPVMKHKERTRCHPLIRSSSRLYFYCCEVTGVAELHHS